MGSNEQPDETPTREITIRLSPENLILAAAILFLLAAVVLAIFFSIDSPNTSVPADGTAVAVGGTTVASGATPASGTANPTPASGEGTAPYPEPGQRTPLPTFETQPYPGPNEPGATTNAQSLPTAGLPTSTSEGLFTVETPTSGTTRGTSAPAPTFAPSRPTATIAGGSSAYPPPGSTSASAAQPTVAVATVASTSAPATNPTVAAPTQAPPTPRPATAQPTSEPAGGAGEPPPAATRPPATPVPPTPIPVDIIRGSMRWSANQSPVIVRRDLQIAPGSTLVIDPGVEVQVAPGVAIYVDGKMYASGQPGKPVRITSTGGGRWDAIYGRPGSDIGFEHVEVSGGGNGGTLISSEGGNLTVLRSQVRNNGGQIRVLDSRLEMRETDVSGNDMPYGAAVDASYTTGGGVILAGNRIGGNRLEAGAPPVQIRNTSPYDTVNLDVQSNLMVGRNGPSMVVSTNGPVRGTMSCNAWMNGTDGLMIKSGTLQVAPEVALTINNNAIEDQTPPIIPIYLEYGIGRGASSDIYIDMTNNWWRSAQGPYHPDLHADGRGEAVGSNITFAPWLTERPSCAPRP